MKSIVCGFLLFVLLTSAVGVTAATDSQYPSSTVEFKDTDGKYTITFTFPDKDDTPYQYGVGYVIGIEHEMCEIKNREDNVVKILVADTRHRYAWVNIDINGVDVTDWAIIARDYRSYRFITKAKKNTSDGCKIRVSYPECIDGICDYPFLLYYLYIDRPEGGEDIVKFFLTPQKEIDLTIQEKHERWIDKAKGTYDVSYTIKNIGDGTVSAGHCTSLFVDGVQKETKIVTADLKPNGVYTATFNTLLTVSGEKDNIKVCGDCNNDVKESDEKNNCRGNVWEAPLKVEITLPVKNFEVQKGKKVNIVANVKDDLNNMVNGLNTDSVMASFTTEKKKIELHDDGKHNDGDKNDGVYANNTWTPTKTGDCTITVTAKKTDFKDGVDKVNGIVIAKPVLEIPALFKNVHPYKQYVCALPQSYFENAPVFQRGVEKPQFEVKGLTGLPSDYELRVVIEEPKGYGQYAVVKNLTISAGWTDDKVVGEWDYSTFSGMRNVESIPIGVYKAQAQLVNKATQDIVQQSVTKEFYVIFEWDSSKKDFITNDNAYDFNKYPSYFGYGRDEFKLHIYDERIWKFALEEITKRASIDYTSKEDVIKKLFGNKAYINMKLKYPDEIDTYWRGKNNRWYDNIKALDAKTGTCTDHSALSIGLLRAIGIPARMIDCSGTGGVVGSEYGKNIDHAFFEAWYKGNWHWFDPTNVVGLYAGTFGSAEYTKTGIQFRPAGVGLKNNGYWVITSGSVPGNTPPVNIYKRYNYNLDVVDLRFDKTSYKPGDTMKITIDVKNTGQITIPNPHLEVMRWTVEFNEAPGGMFTMTDITSQLADIGVAGSLAPNQQVTKTVSGTAPGSTWSSQYVIAKPYTLCKKQKAYTCTKPKRIPGYSIIPIYSIDVDGVKKTLQRFNSSFFESNVTDEKAYIKDSYEWGDMPANVELYSEINLGRNYSETIVTLENHDSESHVYDFSMPIYGFGNAAHVPAIGTITSNTTLNVEASHIITYNQSSDEDINVSVYEFSKEARIEAIEILEHKGVKLVKADACWNITLSPGSSHKICVYSSTRQGQPDIAGFDFSEIYTTLANEIVDNGDSLMNLKVSAPEEVRVAETIPINVTVFNNGIVEETLNLFVNVSRTPRYSRTPNLIYTDTTSISVSPNTEKTLTYPVYISKDTAATVWDVSVDTDKVITATTAFTVNDAFDLDCVQDLEVVHNEVFPFNTTIINTWDTTVHDVKATIHLFGSFTTLDPEELHIGDLLPNERETISWRLSTTYGGELPLDVSVTSDDGGYDMISSTITSLSPPVLWIPNIITHTDAPDFGTSKTVCMNVTLQNLGDLTANSVQVQLLLPENVTSTASKQDIGDLLGGEQKSVSIDITFSTQNDFAFDVVAKDDANHSAIGTMMMSFSAMDLPDLTLTSDNIRVSSNENIVSISATIHNIGTVDASNIVVQFFDGDPDAGGTQIGTDRKISGIAHDSSGTVQVTWTAIPGTHDIFVRVDPYNTIQEAKEDNNQAYKQITIGGAKTISVDDDFTDEPANHKWDTIQEGISDANDGDTVLVYNGTYTETVTLNKTLTLIGEGMPKIDAHGSGYAIHVTSDNCTVKGFCCVNAQPSPYVGIYVKSNNNVIVDNICKDNYVGIYLSGSSNEIRNNIADYNDHHGINLWSSENIIANNTARNNGNNGIFLTISDNNSITDNVAANNNNSGIYLSFSDNNEIRNNCANDNHNDSIELAFSDENVVANNTAKNNGDNGIYLAFSHGNRITDNAASSNVNDGISLSVSKANNIAHNTAKDNGNKGLLLSSSSSNNTIYLNNFVDNLDNAFSIGSSFGSSNTTWHSPSTMTYTYSGNTYTNYLGNYWSDYKGSDTDGDGIGGSSYSIDGDADFYPLMKPWEKYFALQVNWPPHNPTPTPECKVQITSDPSDTDRPSIVYANGFYYVAYQSIEKSHGIYIKKFDSQWKFKKKVEVVSGSAYYDSPSLAFANDKLYVAYISNAEGANKKDYDVIVKEYNPNSFACTSGEKYLTTLQSCQDLPALYYKDGYFYLAYQSWETGNGDIYIKKFDSNWNQLKQVRVTSKSSLQDRPSITYANGYFYVAYYSVETDNLDIFVKGLNSNLNLDVFKKQITFETSRQIYPSIAFVNNQFAIAYASSETGTWGIYMKRYDKNWNYIGKTKVIDDNSAHERRPSIIYAQNDFWIAYVRYLEESDNWYTFVIIPGCE